MMSQARYEHIMNTIKELQTSVDRMVNYLSDYVETTSEINHKMLKANKETVEQAYKHYAKLREEYLQSLILNKE
jgi:hypothetical protein